MADGLGPFYDLEHAAKYCGYSASYFSKIIKNFHFKRYGPSKTRFARADLDQFMAAPENFAAGSTTTTRKPLKLEV